MAEALRTYVQLMNNLSEATRNWAAAAGRALLAQAGLEEAAADAGERMNKLGEEIGNAGRANREMLENLIGAEIEQVVARLGFARTEEVDLLRDELVELRARLVEAELALAAATVPGASPDPGPEAPTDASVTTGRSPRRTPRPTPTGTTATPATKTAARSTTRATTARTSPAKTGPVGTSSTTEAASTRKTAAERAPAKKTAAKRAPATKSAAKKSTGADQ